MQIDENRRALAAQVLLNAVALAGENEGERESVEGLQLSALERLGVDARGDPNVAAVLLAAIDLIRFAIDVMAGDRGVRREAIIVVLRQAALPNLYPAADDYRGKTVEAWPPR